MARYILFFLISGVLLSCTKPSIENTEPSDYYPVADGAFWEYEVKEIQYSVTQEPIVFEYMIREVLTANGQNTFKLQQYKRDSPTDNWEFQANGNLEISNNRVIKTTDGLAELVLVKGAQIGEQWDKNLFNNQGESILQIAERIQDFDSYPDHISVYEKADSSLIHKDLVYTVYANGFGPIYREYTEVEYCQSTEECIGSGEIDSGNSIVWRLTTHGVEN
ncbi:hypothetical protein [Jiulongibacter sp. NS-SX5]|uniref:hypothetical protein n=1 Tax=Jiulongibacter sp. NS-SX5 TaxID=3463854 RepID=UPI004058E9DE